MIQKINDKQNIFDDNIAFTEQWDFSTANLNEQNRILAITQVASICYQSPKALGSETLYNRLLAESIGLPSSSFEFVPILLTQEQLQVLHYYIDNIPKKYQLHVEKYGEYIYKDNQEYLLTNFRALLYDYHVLSDYDIQDITKWFNTKEECDIIKQHFKVFQYKVDLPTRSQMVRHRTQIQELSRRYVSGKRVPFEFYISEKMKDIITLDKTSLDIVNLCVEHYYNALDAGVKPQEARRIIPQMAYTQLWMAFLPNQLDNYLKLRLDSHSQYEIQQTAIAMNIMIIEEQ